MVERAMQQSELIGMYQRYSGGVEFSVAVNGCNLYLKAMDKLQLYASTTYKNGADMQKSFKQDKLMTFTPPELDENAIPTQK